MATGGQGSVVPIDGGGTGADNAEEARANLDVYSRAEVDLEIDNATPISHRNSIGCGKNSNNCNCSSRGKLILDIMTAKKLRDALNAEGVAHLSLLVELGAV